MSTGRATAKGSGKAARVLYTLWPLRQTEVSYEDLSSARKRRFRQWAAAILRAARASEGR